jgi:hypothetical protein
MLKDFKVVDSIAMNCGGDENFILCLSSCIEEKAWVNTICMQGVYRTNPPRTELIAVQ